MYTSLPLTLTNTHRIASPETLLERARAFDSSALAEIHDTYYPVIYRYVSYRLEDEQTVEDIAADVFLRLMDNLYQRERDVRDVRAWLFGTASHLVNDALRKKYRKPVEHLDDHEMLSEGDTPEQTAELNERQRAVRHALQFLTIDQQQVLALRFGLECSLEETSSLMNKTVGAIKTLQFRALAALRRHLEGRNGV